MKKRDALSHFGGVIATANALGISHAAVSKWGEEIPMRRAYEIERLTEGQLKALPENKHNQMRQTT